ncbi:DUF5658 family protein [Haloarcula argentinensis]|uniref:DUF5658 family protein n=1 Tax=Haloarcula argentinensis TaxID=43776 RepID=A0A830FQK1_HALAR|nr:DUF5658 family protein [Haloarcula argentinensis]EMA24602.1 hypothetical protein C443_05559 [Haloarcula argentinensis DSM 12282]MDS0253282.1 DUF5658 family protein [Haloarcula argentinensis]NLV12407.1 hypothetical protein [Haloarcula argentinensis]GGM25816.1 hypothetical protein GCM10009006_03880 [Haloarcula argentinensis]
MVAEGDVLRTDRTVSIGTIDGWCSALLDELVAVERELWLVVAVTLIIDVWLTHVGLQHGLQEGNPLMRAAIETFGIAVLGLTKVGVLGMAGLIRQLLSDQRGVVVPLGLALPWVAAVVINATLLLSL